MATKYVTWEWLIPEGLIGQASCPPVCNPCLDGGGSNSNSGSGSSGDDCLTCEQCDGIPPEWFHPHWIPPDIMDYASAPAYWQELWLQAWRSYCLPRCGQPGYGCPNNDGSIIIINEVPPEVEPYLTGEIAVPEAWLGEIEPEPGCAEDCPPGTTSKVCSYEIMLPADAVDLRCEIPTRCVCLWNPGNPTPFCAAPNICGGIISVDVYFPCFQGTLQAAWFTGGVFQELIGEYSLSRLAGVLTLNRVPGVIDLGTGQAVYRYVDQAGPIRALVWTLCGSAIQVEFQVFHNGEWHGSNSRGGPSPISDGGTGISFLSYERIGETQVFPTYQGLLKQTTVVDSAGDARIGVKASRPAQVVCSGQAANYAFGELTPIRGMDWPGCPYHGRWRVNRA